jgi:hypothetical protein
VADAGGVALAAGVPTIGKLQAVSASSSQPIVNVLSAEGMAA